MQKKNGKNAIVKNFLSIHISVRVCTKVIELYVRGKSVKKVTLIHGSELSRPK